MQNHAGTPATLDEGKAGIAVWLEGSCPHINTLQWGDRHHPPQHGSGQGKAYPQKTACLRTPQMEPGSQHAPHITASIFPQALRSMFRRVQRDQRSWWEPDKGMREAAGAQEKDTLQLLAPEAAR